VSHTRRNAAVLPWVCLQVVPRYLRRVEGRTALCARYRGHSHTTPPFHSLLSYEPLTHMGRCCRSKRCVPRSASSRTL
jgi:hypothetical protein